MEKDVSSLLQLVQSAVSPWHTAAACEKRLQEAGFTELQLGEKWELQRGSYYVKIFSSAVMAFTAGSGDLAQPYALRIAACHTDFPGIRIKPAAGMVKEGYGLLNAETYGGLILTTWLDRPLGMAGKIALAGENPFEPEIRLENFTLPLVTIPSLAIHMNRKVNEGVAIKKQKEMIPLAGVFGKPEGQPAKGKENFFLDWLAEQLHTDREKILSYELNLYPWEEGCQLGLQGELLSASRLDNLTSVEACLQGIAASKEQKAAGINMAVFFDNEEIGSRTKQGAASGVLLQALERIYLDLGLDKEAMWQAVSNGMMLSVDVAHGLHPNYTDKYDVTNKPLLNGGVAVKQAAAQTYAGDAEAVAIVAALCQKHGIKYQSYVNNSDQPGGSTLGSIVSALVPMRAMDVGVPILAMHSARETMGIEDQAAMNELIKAFFTE